MQIHELASLSTALASGTYFAVDNGSVTRKLNYTTLANAVSESMRENNAGYHNSIYRGKSLGTSYTSEQSAAVAGGTFDDMFVGDYWTINGIRWCIADFDTYYQAGDTVLATHHIAVIPNSNMYTTAWNSSADNSSGYVGSAIRANIKADSASAAGAEAKFVAAFGDSHVLSYRAYYPTTYNSDGVATAGAWTDARVELLSEMEAFGSPVWSAPSLGYEIGISKRQLSIFRHYPTIQNQGASWWVRNPRSNAVSCIISHGLPVGVSPTSSGGVRPFGLIS